MEPINGKRRDLDRREGSWAGNGRLAGKSKIAARRDSYESRAPSRRTLEILCDRSHENGGAIGMCDAPRKGSLCTVHELRWGICTALHRRHYECFERKKRQHDSERANGGQAGD
jgi:hypothetical protein